MRVRSSGWARRSPPTRLSARAQFIEVIDVLETVMSNSIAINSMMDPLVVRMRKLPRPLTLSLGSPGQLPLTAGGRV
jgi:hypothetical protein